MGALPGIIQDLSEEIALVTPLGAFQGKPADEGCFSQGRSLLPDVEMSVVRHPW